MKAVLIFASIAVGSSPSIFCQEAQKTADSQAIQQLIQQVQELQAKVRQLEAKVDAKAVTTAVAPPPVQQPSVIAPAVALPAPPSTPQIPDVPTSSPEPSVKLRMFGDVGYEASTQKGETNSFHIGSLDLLLTGNLSDRVSVLGEILFIPQANNGIEADVERLLLQYKHNDYFTVAIGRYHSAIGYYNTAFHRGAWFQTAIDRPFMYAFDDDGGFLPLQEVGVTVNGAIPSGSLGLHYIAEVGNGRSHLLNSDPAQNTQDTNNGKSVNVALYARPSSIPGLQVGFSVYRDHLSFADNINHSELISTAYVVYTNSRYEFLNEVMLVRHGGTNTGGPGVFHTPAFYTQVSRKFRRYQPYFRYAYINAGVNEPIYGDPADGPVVGRRNGPTFGLRFEINGHAAVKLQFDHLAQRDQKSFDALETQVAFAF